MIGNGTDHSRDSVAVELAVGRVSALTWQITTGLRRDISTVEVNGTLQIMEYFLSFTRRFESYL
jgi:hypothetical protein